MCSFPPEPSNPAQDPALFNWLADLDSRAVDLVQGTSWLNYPYFMFTRYPGLQPAASGRNAGAGRMSFLRKLADQEVRMTTHKHGNRIFQGLTSEERRQLAALVVDCLPEFEKHREGTEHGKHLTRRTNEAARRQRRLDKLVGRVRTALEQLHSYAQELDPQLGKAHSELAQSGLAAIGRLKHYPSAEEWAKDRENHAHFPDIAGFSPFPSDPISSAMVQLYWFFRHQCCLSANDAEIRVALVREAFFATWNKPVQIVPRHKTAHKTAFSAPGSNPESRGAGAVAQAVRRFRP